MPFGLSGKGSNMFGLPPSRARIFRAFPSPPVAQGVLLARIGQAVAVPAREWFARCVEQRNAAPTISAVGVDGTAKPSASAAKAAWRPGNRHALFDRLPVAIF